MFMIIFGSLVSLMWIIIGVSTLHQPTITHASYACVWITLTVWFILSTISDVIAYVYKRKVAKQLK